ncbi:MAG: DUF4169 family protein [Oceanicaulis sp.]|uniref:DUF4169 family protein n=1 Tax=Glycocaulis sp. TaxID=1969725 RepID=UPI0025BE1CE5|nr:DUF4169 family protein [Glycocaulis sp.]MCC5981810.1 DUF4169 family protein [Oceanicaulis sp.]MCH8521215.1 DUF4169 family protein [Glycocaulis sp.]
MAELVNLRSARKRKAREAAAKDAAANRAAFGQTKAEKLKRKAEGEKAARDLDGKKRN